MLTFFPCLQFISSRGNEYFCEIDEDYLTDRFNLTGLNTEVQYYQYALDLITDVFDLDCDDDMRETIEKSARHLYGLIHARYIVTTRGLAKMVCIFLLLSSHSSPLAHIFLRIYFCIYIFFPSTLKYIRAEEDLQRPYRKPRARRENRKLTETDYL
jgi:hypothetical protein